MINKLLCVLLANLMTLAFACESEDKEQLMTMQQLWSSQDTGNYSYVVQKQCFCSPNYTQEMLVQVVNGNVSDAQYVDTNDQVPKEIVGQLATISEWFNKIFNAVDNQQGDITVLYDDVLGYPANIRIDENKRRSDDEFTIIISKVTQQ